MNDKEYLSRLLQSAYATSSFSDFAKQFPMTSDEALKPKVVSKKAWDTLCSWIVELIIVDGKQVDIGYSNREKSEIRITIQYVNPNGDTAGSETADVYRLLKDDIGVAVLPERISKILRGVWNKKELERYQTDSQYFINRYTYITGVDPYKK
jgi:hypothetical protein